MIVELDNMKQELKDYDRTLEEVKQSLDLTSKEQRIEELERKMEEPDFWNDPEKAQKQTKELGDLKNDRDTYNKLVSSREDIETMIEMGEEENDSSVVSDIRAMLDDYIGTLDSVQIKTLLSDEYDDANAIMRLNAGAGGTEAMDWCAMLYRMYTRWAEKKNFKIEVLDLQEGDEAGIKSVMFQVDGTNAYGLLKSESGVHRLVRISPFNAQAKRQTSFVSCDVMPELNKDINIELKDEDLKIDVYRSSGAGGQHINKTSSAVRITHIPTGIVVTCQNERSHFQNLDKAKEVLKSKLYLLEKQKQEEKEAGIRGEVTDIAWGHQIRSYVLQPYTMVKDLRTNYEKSQAGAVLDGDLDGFIFAYLKWQALKKKSKKQ